MGDHVVHLPGDALPLLQDRPALLLVLAELLLYPQSALRLAAAADLVAEYQRDGGPDGEPGRGVGGAAEGDQPGGERPHPDQHRQRMAHRHGDQDDHQADQLERVPWPRLVADV